MDRCLLNILTANDLLHQLIIPQYEDFVRKNSSVRHALLTTILAYHMYEWVHEEKFTENHFKATYSDEDDMVELFEVARIISNDIKHCKFKSITKVQTGFSSGFSNGFARPLNVELPDGRLESMDNVLEKLVDFWKHREHLGKL